MMFFKLGLRFAAANRQRLRMKFFGVIHVCILLQKREIAILRLFRLPFNAYNLPS